MSTRTVPPRSVPPTGKRPTGPGDDGDFTPSPRRPQRRLITPLTGALVAILIAAVGFFVGVEVQKNSGSSTGTAGLPSFPGAAAGGQGASGGAPSGAGVPSGAGIPSGAGAAAGGAPPGFPGAPGGQAGRGTQGTVSYIKKGVIYIKDGDGNTLKVKVSGSTDVTRTASTSAGQVHPGDAVTVQGKTSGSSVKATSVTATAADN